MVWLQNIRNMLSAFDGLRLLSPSPRLFAPPPSPGYATDFDKTFSPYSTKAVGLVGFFMRISILCKPNYKPTVVGLL